MSNPHDDDIPEMPEAELDMAMEELGGGPNTKMPADQRIERLNRRVAYLTAQLKQICGRDEVEDEDFRAQMIDRCRADLTEAQRQLNLSSKCN